MTPLVLLILVGWFGLGLPLTQAVGIGVPVDPNAPAPVGPRGQATTVRIVSPRDGATIAGSTVSVRVKLNGKLVTAPQVRRDTRDGLVHLHFQLDGGKYDDPAHSSSTLFDQEGSTGSYSGAVTRKLAYRGVEPGTHTLRVELVNNDHDPAGALSASTVTFTTTAP